MDLSAGPAAPTPLISLQGDRRRMLAITGRVSAIVGVVLAALVVGIGGFGWGGAGAVIISLVAVGLLVLAVLGFAVPSPRLDVATAGLALALAGGACARAYDALQLILALGAMAALAFAAVALLGGVVLLVPLPAAPAVPAAGGTAAAWYPDPSDPSQWRYWDGAAWTEHVSAAGAR